MLKRGSGMVRGGEGSDRRFCAVGWEGGEVMTQ